MKRLRRRLFNIVVALSAVLCFATTLMMIRGLFVSDRLMITPRVRHEVLSYIELTFQGGHLFVEFTRYSNAESRMAGWGSYPAEPLVWHRSYARGSREYGEFWLTQQVTWHFGIGIGSLTTAGLWGAGIISDVRIVAAPLWALAVPSAILPCIGWLRLWMIRRRVRAGTCRNCGYDLRATPDRCPECGTIPVAAK